MKALTKDGQLKLEEIAIRNGLTKHSVETMLQALINGNGTMAQFNIPELGGQGQWMKGGMTMIGDMFNATLKLSVNTLCSELSNLLNEAGMVEERPERNPSSGLWWPAEFGRPNASGSQNTFRYAYFGAPVHRLVIETDGRQTIYDTTGHHISGVSQQQGGVNRYSFTSQQGTVDLSTLKVIRSTEDTGQEQKDVAAPSTASVPAQDSSAQEKDVFTTIEKLALLKQKGYITDEEYQNKKAELLSRL